MTKRGKQLNWRGKHLDITLYISPQNNDDYPGVLDCAFLSIIYFFTGSWKKLRIRLLARSRRFFKTRHSMFYTFISTLPALPSLPQKEILEAFLLNFLLLVSWIMINSVQYSSFFWVILLCTCIINLVPTLKMYSLLRSYTIPNGLYIFVYILFVLFFRNIASNSSNKTVQSPVQADISKFNALMLCFVILKSCWYINNVIIVSDKHVNIKQIGDAGKIQITLSKNEVRNFRSVYSLTIWLMCL